MAMCINLEELLKAQKKFIADHLPEHSYYKMMSDKNKATMDFINAFSWVFKEGFCKCCKKCEDWNKPHYAYY
jgi:hypothetical protein